MLFRSGICWPSLLLFYAKELGHCALVELRADHADAARNHCAAITDIRLARDIVKVDPLLTPGIGNIALGAQNDAICPGILQRLQDPRNLILGELLVRFLAPADEYLVGVMAVVMVMMVVFMLVLVIIVVVMVAGAFRIVTLVVLVMMMVVMFVLILVIIVVMMRSKAHV